MARKKAAASGTAWDDVESLNRPADEVPRRGSIAKKTTGRFRFARIVVWAAALTVVPNFLFSAANNNAIGNLRWEIANLPAAESVSSPGKGAAYDEMGKWLRLDPQPLVGGTIVSWDGFEVVKKPEQTEQEAKTNPLPNYEMEIHSFTLVDARGNLYHSAIQIAVGPQDTGTAVVGTPSLTPYPPNAQIPVETPWYGFFSSGASESVQQAVGAWAKAYTSGSPEDLLLAVGDSDGKHSYMPLIGVTSVVSKVTSSAYVPPADDDRYQQGQATSKMIAQVTLILTWADAPVLEDGKRNTTTVTYDVLVENADTASPRVVAWGDPGTAPQLEPYANAIEGNDIKNGVQQQRDQSGTIPTTPTPDPSTGTDDGTGDGNG